MRRCHRKSGGKILQVRRCHRTSGGKILQVRRCHPNTAGGSKAPSQNCRLSMQFGLGTPRMLRGKLRYSFRCTLILSWVLVGAVLQAELSCRSCVFIRATVDIAKRKAQWRGRGYCPGLQFGDFFTKMFRLQCGVFLSS